MQRLLFLLFRNDTILKGFVILTAGLVWVGSSMDQSWIKTFILILFLIGIYFRKQDIGFIAALYIVTYFHIGLYKIQGLPVVSILTLIIFFVLLLGFLSKFELTIIQVFDNIATENNRVAIIGVLLLLTTFFQGTVLSLINGNEYHWFHVIGILRYWGAFILLGILVSMSGGQEFKKFTTTFALLFLPSILLYIPPDEYVNFFKACYQSGAYPTGIGLGFGSLNPNTLGYYAVFGSLCAVVASYDYKEFKRLFFILSWMLSSILVILTHSRGAVFAWLTCATTTFWLLGIARSKAFIYSIFFLSLLVYAFPGSIPPSLKSRWSEITISPEKWQSNSIRDRTNSVYRMLFNDNHKRIALFKNQIQFFFGQGFGISFLLDVRENGDRVLLGSHLLIIDLLREIGVLGLSLFLLSFLSAILGFYRTVKIKRDQDRKRIIIFVVGLSIIVIIESNLSGGMYGAMWLPFLFGFFTGNAIILK